MLLVAAGVALLLYGLVGTIDAALKTLGETEALGRVTEVRRKLGAKPQTPFSLQAKIRFRAGNGELVDVYSPGENKPIWKVGDEIVVRYPAHDPGAAIPANKSRFTLPLLALGASPFLLMAYFVGLKLARRAARLRELRHELDGF